jgi:hypothetical protein
MSGLARIFVIRSGEDAQRLISFLKLNAPSAIEADAPLECSVYVHKPRASDAQHNTIRLINEQVAQQAWVRGQQFDHDTWHEHMKRELLPEVNSRGKRKWRYLPDESRELAMGTTDLNREEKSVYIDAQLAFAASLGVTVEIKSPQYQPA